jgi:hypothetical protein
VTGILMLRGTRTRLMAVELADHDDPWSVTPIVRAIEEDLPTVRIKPGMPFERPTKTSRGLSSWMTEPLTPQVRRVSRPIRCGGFSVTRTALLSMQLNSMGSTNTSSRKH